MSKNFRPVFRWKRNNDVRLSFSFNVHDSSINLLFFLKGYNEMYFNILAIDFHHSYLMFITSAWFIYLFIYLFWFFWLINLYTYPLLVSLLVLFHLFIWSFLRIYKPSINSEFYIDQLHAIIHLYSVYLLFIYIFYFILFLSFKKNIISYNINSIYQN